jgi:small-conductance mechanosensitive channel
MDQLEMGGQMGHENNMMSSWNSNWLMWILMFLPLFAILLLVFWTYQDATQQHENATLWAFVVFITMGLGIIFYALIRKPDISFNSNPISTPSSREASYSPKTSDLRSPSIKNQRITRNYCEQCGLLLETIDNFCPKCGKSVQKGY